MWSIAKSTGRPLNPDLVHMQEWPHTIATVVALRQKYDSLSEFSEPLPQEYWDFPHLVRAHVEKMYPNASKTKSSYDIAVDEVEG